MAYFRISSWYYALYSGTKDNDVITVSEEIRTSEIAVSV